MVTEWEYLTEERKNFLTTSELNYRGDLGWELVNFAVVPGKVSGRCIGDVEQSDHEFVYIFKRPKK